MKKYQSHPIGSKSFPQVNETFFFQKIRKNKEYRYGKKINGKGEEIILEKTTHHTTRNGDTMNPNEKRTSN